MPHTIWTADILPGFEQSTLKALVAADGPVDVTMIRRRCNASSGAAVLYVHGYVDYFFQAHLADFYNARGLHFYAVDLRRHGRSLRPHQLPNFTRDIDEYLHDVDVVLEVLRDGEHVDWLLLNGHSTGGLVAALYAHRGKLCERVNAVFLNSPFLDMNLTPLQERFVEPVLAWLGGWLPRMRCPGMPHVYGQSIHTDHHGQWRFNTAWKPIAGFPVYAGWFRAMHRAHTEVAHGLAINCPCLVLHAGQSLQLTGWTEAAMTADVVLDVKDIARLAPGLGQQIEVHAIADGVHDLTLSRAFPRDRLWAILGAWLERVRGLGVA